MYHKSKYYTVIFDFYEIEKEKLDSLILFTFRLSYKSFIARKHSGIIYFSAMKAFKDLKRIFEHRYPEATILKGKLTGKDLEYETKNFFGN